MYIHIHIYQTFSFLPAPSLLPDKNSECSFDYPQDNKHWANVMFV